MITKYPNRPIKIGEKDKLLVKALQKKLNEKGYGLIAVDGDFGTKTRSAVKLFQTQNTDQNGNLLVVDGILGPITWAILFGENSVVNEIIFTNYLSSQAIKIALSQLGVREVGGANCGPEVEKYLNSIGLGKGYPWCMAFVYWCFLEASKNLQIENSVIKTGGVLHGWNKANCKKILAKDTKIDPSLVKPGHIFIMDFGRGYGHTGIVKSVEGGFITTIEGNTNNNRSREGIGVFELNRKIKDINKGFLEY
jgi:hypothetical protein